MLTADNMMVIVMMVIVIINNNLILSGCFYAIHIFQNLRKSMIFTDLNVSILTDLISTL